jgi:SAM-dependent methyltransferase
LLGNRILQVSRFITDTIVFTILGKIKMRLSNEELAFFTKNYSAGNDAALIVHIREDGKRRPVKALLKRLLGMRSKEAENDAEVDAMTKEIIAQSGRVDLGSITAYLHRMFARDDHLRKLEYPFMAECITEKIEKKDLIVDIGGGNAWSTKLLMLLQIPGSKILSVDVVNHCASSKYNVEYLKGNCLHTPLATESVDVVVSISTFEHVGLGRWGDPIDPDGDIKEMREVHRILRSGGYVVLTLPYGAPTVVYNLHRIYNDGRIKKMIEGFSIAGEGYSLHGKKCEKTAVANLKIAYSIPGFYDNVPDNQKLPNAQGGIMLLLKKR